MPRLIEESPGRSHPRFQLEAPVLVRWDDGGSARQTQGSSRDISASGIFVVCSTLPAIGTEIQFEVQLPPVSEGTRGMQLRSTGRVVRLAGPGEEPGFGARAELASADW
jgi:hypothetical protein